MFRGMSGVSPHLGAIDRASMFDTFEQAATRVGLALFVVHVDANPPTVIYASDLLAELVGRPAHALVGRPPWELVAAEQRERVRAIIASRGPGAPSITVEVEIERPDGSRREIEVGVARTTTASAELAVCYFRDVTDERRAIDELRRSEARFRTAIESAPDAIVIIQDGRIVVANPSAVRWFGAPDFEAVRGRLLSDYLPPEEAARAAERMAQLRAGAEPGPAEYRMIGDRERIVDVHTIPYEHEGRPAFLSFVRDVTERKRLQQELVRADRLAVMGTLAATVAHEINNPLTYLQLGLQRLEHELASERDPVRAESLRELVADSLDGVQRIARIVRDLRVHARDKAEETVGPVDVVAVVERALKMVEHDVRHRARLVCRFPRERAIVEAAAGRLEQVVVNILVNAIQSLEGNDPSNQITVDVEVADAVTIAVTDTGCGIADRERAFEPFYTTKPIGEGSGLGLSVCKQIVETMRGRIEIASTVGAGTKITIVLPRMLAPRSEPVAAAPRVSEERLRILVVDDEPLVRRTMTAIVSSQHEVDEAEGGEAALAMLRESTYDVIICDLMMPRVSGREVYERLRELRPGLERRIVFVTGGAFVPALAGFLESIDNPRLAKPFTSERVLAVICAAHRRARS
jgi:PAS domain S-box-containing protein